ncbi:elongation factor 1-beta [Candidatus Pacearchaeota archaeon]|nr:elongation factor 1-beta [Candidatus Pacearchaeota archaeon]
MGTALIKIKIMPSSPEADLEEIKESAKEKILSGEGEKPNFKEEPVAFGLKAIVAQFSLDESKELDSIEESLKKIKDVNSVQVIDMRRAFG